MKKATILTLILSIVSVFSLSASNRNAPKLLYGNAQFVLEDALVYFNLDYSHAVEVEYAKDGETVETVKGHGIFEEGNATHDQVIPNFMNMYVKQYNRVAGKSYPTRMTLNRDEAKYELTIEIDTIDTGNTVGKIFGGIAGGSKGNVIFSGKMIVREIATGNMVFSMGCSQLTTWDTAAIPAARFLSDLGFEFSFKYLFSFDIIIGKANAKKGYNIPYLYPDGQK